MSKLTSKIGLPLRDMGRKMGDFIYDIRVSLHQKAAKRQSGKPKKLSVQKKKDLVFYVSVFTVPLIFFILNNIVINGNSFLLGFTKYNFLTGQRYWNGIGNFFDVVNVFKTDIMLQGALLRSIKVYLIQIPITTVIPILFAYYIYKKKPGYRVFKVIIFIPTIISGIITVSIYKTITERMIPTLFELITKNKLNALLSNPETAFNTVFFYSIWMSFGGGLLILLASMNTVDESVSEAAKLEGLGFFRELWYIVLPVCYEVLAINFVMGFCTLFTNDLGLFAFFGTNADARLYTLGYYFTIKTMQATNFEYPFYAAWGLLTSFIAIPVTLVLRYLLLKYGPSED